MKKYYTLSLSFFVLFSLTQLIAQPVITSPTFPSLGTKIKQYNVTSSIAHGAAGANQTWDYSGATVDSSTTYFKYETYASLPQDIKDSFPTGTHVRGYYINNYPAKIVLQLTGNELLMLGLNYGSYFNVNSPPDTTLAFPLSYQQNVNGVLYDGYGTLKAPFGTYTNVVRLQTNSGNNIFNIRYAQTSPGLVDLLTYDYNSSTQAISNARVFHMETAAVVIAPAAPSSLTALPGAGQMTLNWADNSTNEEGFVLERSTNSTTWTLVDTIIGISHIDNGLANLTTYYYRVHSYNSGGASAYSNIASGTTTGIASHESSNQITISPNPSTGIFTIHNLSNDYSTFKVFNSIGSVVFKEHRFTGKFIIDLSSLSNGVYIMQFEGGNKLQTHKVVIQK